MSWAELLAALLRGEQLSSQQTVWAMRQTVSGQATPAQIGGFVVALRAKGETAQELSGLVEATLEHMLPMPQIPDAVDVVGTGGDGANTVNISTMAALVTAAAGAPVIKHGNRAASSACGSADVLEKLGVQIEASAQQVSDCVARIGIGFCFARHFHPGLRHAAAVRHQLGVPTVFNFLGPLSNPAQPTAAAVGCTDVRMAPLLAQVLAQRGMFALVMRGEDGLDEFTTTTATQAWVAASGRVYPMLLDAAELGIARAQRGQLTGGNAAHNAAVAHRVLDGEHGAIRDATVINAAAALAAHRRFGGGTPTAHSVTAAMAAALSDARRAIDSGAARQTLERWISFS